MPRAFAQSKKGAAPPGGDAFVDRSWELLTWVQHHLRAVTLGAVVLTLMVAGTLYYRNYQATVREQAAAELQSLAISLASEGPAVAAERLKTFIARYGQAPAAYEGRLILAHVQLDLGQPDAALLSLDPVLKVRAPDTPLGNAARILHAAARETQGELPAAIQTLLGLAESARLPFQRQHARAEAARLMVQSGQQERALATYQELVEEATQTDQLAAAAGYRLRIGELQARLAHEPSASETEAGTDPSANPSPAPSPKVEDAPLAPASPVADSTAR